VTQIADVEVKSASIYDISPLTVIRGIDNIIEPTSITDANPISTCLAIDFCVLEENKGMSFMTYNYIYFYLSFYLKSY
jgi:hypothetical protein